MSNKSKMTKPEHTFWLKEVDKMFLGLGAEKFIYSKGYESEGCIVPTVWAYKLQTIGGELVMHPDIPWKLNKDDKTRLDYTCCVFGRFSDTDKLKELRATYLSDRVNSYNGKFNYHLGPREMNEIEDVVNYIKGDLKSMLIN